MTRSTGSDSLRTDPGCRLAVADSDARGLFVVTAGDRAGRVLPFVRQGLALAMGRSFECTARFDAQSISRVHARAVWIGDQYMIADAGSTNGTFINGHRITFTTALRSGDQVRLGPELTLRFGVLDPEEECALIQASEPDDRDPVTGVVGRCHLEHALDAGIRCAKRRGAPLSLMKMEIDQLDAINASQGPLVTDEIVAGVARTMRQRVRDGDILGSHEDGQFVLIAPATSLTDATCVAQQIRSDVEIATYRSRVQSFRVTVSIGVASLACCGVEVDRLSVLFLADQRVYLAKRKGNAVVSTGGCLAGSLRSCCDEMTLGGATDPGGAT